MLRVGFAGDGVHSLRPELPAASVRLLLPPVDGAELVMPTWDGNVFLLPNGSRAPIRTLTPLRVGDDEIDLDVVVHAGGRLSGWAETATPRGLRRHLGPGSGVPDRSPRRALPARRRRDGAARHRTAHRPHRACRHDHGSRRGRPRRRPRRPARPPRPLPSAGSTCRRAPPPGTPWWRRWRPLPSRSDTRVWAAGEAAAMFRVRRHLFEELGHRRAMPRFAATGRRDAPATPTAAGDPEGRSFGCSICRPDPPPMGWHLANRERPHLVLIPMGD